MKKKKTEDFFFIKTVRIPMYGGNFVIIFSDNPERVGKVLSSPMSSNNDFYAFSFSNFMHQGWESFAVVFNFWDTIPITMGTIMHEVTHAGNKLMASREFDPDWNNDEAEAYLKGWMGDQVEMFIHKCGLL
jgi:hypothetical protein